VDVHSHVYLPRYASFLSGRAVAPRIFSRPVPGQPGVKEDRLVILDNEPSGGRPVGPQVLHFSYSDTTRFSWNGVAERIEF
jgi:aminocarboxymuconate-semialdehyde decarboxylase